MAIGIIWSLVCLIVFFAILYTDRMGLFGSKNHFPVDGRTVLITGASQGMGRAAARQLAAKGANIVIAARTESKLQDSLKYIAEGAKSPAQRFHYISVDLTSAAECARLISETMEWNNGSPPDIVWCIAGAAHPLLFSEAPVDLIRTEVETNYFTSAYVAHTILRLWLGKGTEGKTEVKSSGKPALPRHLIFTTSVACLFPCAGYSIYAPAKCALRGLADSLSQEINLYNGSTHASSPIRIQLIIPGTILSEGLEVENEHKPALTKMLEEDDPRQTPEQTAKVSIAGLEAGNYMVPASFLGRLAMSSVLGGSERNGIADTLLGILAGIISVFVRKDFDKKTQKWGREKGTSGSVQ